MKRVNDMLTQTRFASIVALLSLVACDGTSAPTTASGTGATGSMQRSSGGSGASAGGTTSQGSGGSGGAVTTSGGSGGAGPVSVDAGSDAGFNPGDITHGACCAAHATAGCEDEAVRVCVCAADPRCCTGPWNDECVALVTGLGCAVCKADCCTASSAAGCTDPTVESCVCKKSPECCSAAWDDFCVLLVGSNAGGTVCGHCN